MAYREEVVIAKTDQDDWFGRVLKEGLYSFTLEKTTNLPDSTERRVTMSTCFDLHPDAGSNDRQGKAAANLMKEALAEDKTVHEFAIDALAAMYDVDASLLRIANDDEVAQLYAER